jgi:glycosyltransferase involved in cell wall biosynthesis
MTNVRLEIALGGSDAPREALQSKGWRIENPLEVADTSEDFQKYLRASRGEVTVAKHGYVESNSGWFSERSANYLASGRPVIAQDTGYTEWLPTGDGLFSFSDPAEVIEAIDAVERDYSHHSTHARRIAEEYFDSRQVLIRMLDEAAG